MTNVETNREVSSLHSNCGGGHGLPQHLPRRSKETVVLMMVLRGPGWSSFASFFFFSSSYGFSFAPFSIDFLHFLFATPSFILFQCSPMKWSCLSSWHLARQEYPCLVVLVTVSGHWSYQAVSIRQFSEKILHRPLGNDSSYQSPIISEISWFLRQMKGICDGDRQCS